MRNELALNYPFCYYVVMVVRMRHTKGHRNAVRSHHALKPGGFVACSHCNQPSISHRVCANCGYYAGKQVIDVLAALDKKQRKIKEKELHQHEKDAAEKGKTLNAEELSHK